MHPFIVSSVYHLSSLKNEMYLARNDIDFSFVFNRICNIISNDSWTGSKAQTKPEVVLACSLSIIFRSFEDIEEWKCVSCGPKLRRHQPGSKFHSKKSGLSGGIFGEIEFYLIWSIQNWSNYSIDKHLL